MKTASGFPREYRVPASQDFTRNIKDPYQVNDGESKGISLIHSLVKIRDFPSGTIPDTINPRSHEKINLNSKIPQAIAETLREQPEVFHLLNRGCLIIAKEAWYDNKTKMLHFVVEDENDHGMVDGATTDKVLAELKKEVSQADFGTLREDEIPDYFKTAYLHLEIVAGDINQELRIRLADARNTSLQVKEFSLEDLGGGFEWLKEIIEQSEFRGKIRYRENEPKPVDIRTVLALLTLFHPRWIKLNKDPIVAYTGKGAVLNLYIDPEEKEGFKKLAPVVLHILKLYEFLHVEFKTQYQKAYGTNGVGAKLGRRKEVRYIDDEKRAKELPLTGKRTKYVLPDGWLYPLLGSFRTMLAWPKNGKGEVKWATDPFEFFLQRGSELVEILVEGSKELGQNPNATGKSRRVWVNLRDKVENWLLKERILQLENE